MLFALARHEYYHPLGCGAPEKGRVTAWRNARLP
jgi:hypothetical protein